MGRLPPEGKHQVIDEERVVEDEISMLVRLAKCAAWEEGYESGFDEGYDAERIGAVPSAKNPYTSPVIP
jgi:hypothetical protein